MRIPQVREALSWVPVKLKPSVNGFELSIATGFVYQHNGRGFLITNYHVVSGRHPDTGAVLHSSGACPDAVTIGIPTDAGEHEPSGASILEWKWRTLRLYSQDEPTKRVWAEHPQHGHRFDAVAIAMSDLGENRTVAANAESLDLAKIRVYPGLEAFVLGYPRGMSGGGHFPIWKRATIATEPDFDLDGLPRFYIDTATREGMSGSPVYAQEVGYWLPEDENNENKAVIGKGRRFVGVYSGRLGAEDEFKAQLGIVWKESGLISLIESIPIENGDVAP